MCLCFPIIDNWLDEDFQLLSKINMFNVTIKHPAVEEVATFLFIELFFCCFFV